MRHYSVPLFCCSWLFLVKAEDAVQAQPAFTRVNSGVVAADSGHSQSVSLVDYDGDGWVDVFVTNAAGERSFLYRNLGDGQFEKVLAVAPVTAEQDDRAATWGDYDNDGDLDLFVARCCGANNALFQNNGDGSFTEVTTGVPVNDGGDSQGAGWGDYDQDGLLDLFVANLDGPNFLYHNDGAGGFTRITAGSVVEDNTASAGGNWVDYDLDGDLDLFVANLDDQNNLLYRNDGGGSFTKITDDPVTLDGGHSFGGSWGDFNNDGFPDLFVANVGQNNFLYRNNGDGSFTKVTSGVVVSDPGDSQGSSWGDFDGDGFLDLFVANISGQNNFLYRNNGDGTFTRLTDEAPVLDGGDSRATAWGDLDRDGDLDLFVANRDGVNFLYLNNGHGNGWFSVGLQGVVSNTAGIGASVAVKANDRWQTRQVSAQTGHAGQNSLRLTFGLGPTTQVDSLVVTWPSGGRDTTASLPANLHVTVREQAGLLKPTAVLNESALEVALNAGESTTRTLTLANTGLELLSFELSVQGATVVAPTNVESDFTSRSLPPGRRGSRWPAPNGALRARASTAEPARQANLWPFARYTVKGGYVARGVGLRGTGSGRITLDTLPTGATVLAAFLYWTTLMSGPPTAAIARGQVNGVEIVGENIGADGDPCWQGLTGSFSFRADVTQLVSGNGVYELSDFADSGDFETEPSVEGASLVVVFEHPDWPTQAVLLYEGNQLVKRAAERQLSGFVASSPVLSASLTYVVADGQADFTEHALFNGQIIGRNNFDASDGPFWDTDTFDVTARVADGAKSVLAGVDVTVNDSPFFDDCLVWVATVFSVSGFGESDWLTATPGAGVVPPGDSVTLQVRFDATALNAGTYLAELRLRTNDFLAPELSVDTRLHVSGIPDISVPDGPLQAGQAFVGDTVRVELPITNRGTERLNVTAVTSDRTIFFAEAAPFSLTPGETRRVPIGFAPEQPVAVSATLTVTSNDPDEPSVTVTVQGEGLVPPDIEVATDTLQMALFTGESRSQGLTVANVGANDLEITVSLRPAGGTSSANAGRISATGAHLAAGRTPIPASFEVRRRAVAARLRAEPYGTGRPRTARRPHDRHLPAPRALQEAGGRLFYVDAENFEITELDPGTGDFVNAFLVPEPPSGGPDGLAFDGTDLYYVVGFGTNQVYRIDPTLGQPTDALFLDELGPLDGLGHSGHLLFALGFTRATLYKIHYPSGTILDQVTFDFEIGGGLTFAGSRGTLFLANFDVTIYEVDPRTWEIVNRFDPPDGEVFGLGYSEALGLLLVSDVTTETLYAVDPDDGTVVFSYPLPVGSALATDEANPVPFVRVTPRSSTVSEGTSRELSVTLDAFALEEGTYLADIVLTSNDPDERRTVVPVRLRVTAAPDVFVLSDTLRFGEVEVGQTAVRELVVVNLGQQPLSVHEVSLDTSAFRVTPQAFVLAPNSRQTLQVTFAPTSDGDRSGRLLLRSNDPDEAEVTVTLEARALAAPVAPFTRVTAGAVVEDLGNSLVSNWVHFNQDARPDLFVTNGDNGLNYLYRNNGDGTFLKLVTGALLEQKGDWRGSTWGDFDNDGRVDALLSNFGQGVVLFRNEGSGAFAPLDGGDLVQATGAVQGVAWGDFDRDGWLDLFVVADAGTPNRLFRNNGDGTFSLVADQPPGDPAHRSVSAAWGDLDGDGDLDLFVANGGPAAEQSNLLYTNNGDGTFSRVTEGPVVNDGGRSLGGSWGDFDNDGDLDLVVTNAGQQPLFLYANLGEGRFERVTAGVVAADRGDFYASAWADYNNDGWLDLFVSDFSAANRLYRNNGDGTFTRITDGALVHDPGASTGSSWGDFDRDGFVDLFVANADSQGNFLYRNQGNGHHWLNLRCVGVTSNASAVGTKVWAKANISGRAVWQVREISAQTGGGFGGQNSLNVAFGLGDATLIDSLRIDWPSGLVQVFTRVRADRFLRITEGQPTLTAVNPSPVTVPETFVLSQNYPNPFNPETVIRFQVPRRAFVTLRVYNLLGEVVRTLAAGDHAPGRYTVTWDGRDEAGRPVASGIYLYQLQADGFTQVRKMTLLR